MPNKRKIQIVGALFTFETSSFARVNKGLAQAFSKLEEVDISVHQADDKVDKIPSKEDFNKYPELAKLWDTEPNSEADVVIYHNFPKDGFVEHGLKDLKGRLKLMFLAWEETAYPKMWVDEINNYLHGVLVPSKFVKEVLRESGVKIPIEVVSEGLDELMIELEPSDFQVKTTKKRKFLHVSTAKARKGVDVLIAAFDKAFTAEDDVCLILKTSFSPDNKVPDLLESRKGDNLPEIIHLQKILPDEDLKALMLDADIHVYPSRAEGFGLPIAEAMYHKKTLITTEYSGQTEFVNHENALLVDYEVEKVLNSEFGLVGSYWAEPSVDDLAAKLKKAHENYNSEEHQKMRLRAKEDAKELTWENTVHRIQKFIDFIEDAKAEIQKEQKLAVITPYNSQDGIADHSEQLYTTIEKSFKETYFIANKDITDRSLKDAENVVRLWETSEREFERVVSFIKEKQINIVHIQYHSGFHYPIEGLDILLEKLEELGVQVILTLHQIKAPGFDILNSSNNLGLADTIIIHNKNDFDLVKKNYEQVEYQPLPRIEFKRRNKQKLQKKLGLNDYGPIIATHGFLTEKNNMPNTIKAIASLKSKYPDILLLAVNAVSANNSTSQSELVKAQAVVQENGLEQNVIFITNFLSIPQIEVLLQSAYICLLAYKDVGESGSAAIGKCLASGNPTVVTNIPQFSEFKKEVVKVPNQEPESIAQGIEMLWEDNQLQKRVVDAASKYIVENTYEVFARKHLQLYGRK